MKPYLLLSFSLFFFAISFSQNPACNGTRYTNPIFNIIKVTSDLQYGQSIGLNGSTKDLLLDIYEPADDTFKQRPVILLAHGGSFVGGDKSDLDILCRRFASRGYVAATINYRLINAIVTDSTEISEIVVMATLDMKAAVRYFRENAVLDNTYGIDPSIIIVGGISAGAITANHHIFLDSMDIIPNYILNHIEDNGGFEGNSSDNIFYSSESQGLLNYSGSLGRINWINEGDITFYSAHDDLDPVVPCGYGATNVVPFPVLTYGSCSISDRANEVNIENELFLIENSMGHVSYFTSGNSAITDTVINQSLRYMANIVCNNISNKVPNIKNDSATTLQNQPINIDVLANDTDIDGTINTDKLEILEIPKQGILTIENNNSITYNPNQNFTGVDTFQYVICDDGSPVLCSKAAVTININTPTNLFNNTSYQLNIVPNPVDDRILINSNLPLDVYQIRIVDLAGSVIYYEKSISFINNFSLDASNLKTGIYFLELIQPKKRISLKQKIIKQ